MNNYTPQDYIYKDILEMLLSDNDYVKLREGVELTLDNASEIYSDPEDYLEGEYVEDAVYEATYDYRHTGEDCNPFIAVSLLKCLVILPICKSDNITSNVEFSASGNEGMLVIDLPILILLTRLSRMFSKLVSSSPSNTSR